MCIIIIILDSGIISIFYLNFIERYIGGQMHIIVDVVIILIVLLTTIVGIKRGFVKTMYGLITSILVIVIAVFATTPLTSLVIKNTTWDDKLEVSLQGALSPKIPNGYGSFVYYDLNSDGTTELAFKPENSDEYKAYDKVFEGTPYGMVNLQKLIRKTVEKNLNEDDADSNIAVADAVAKTLTLYIFLAGFFIVIVIVSKIIFMILMRLLLKAVQSLYFVHFVDKTLGGVFGLVLGALVVLVVLSIIQAMSSLPFMSSVNAFLEKTTITKFIMNNNFLYTFFTKYVNLEKLQSLFKK